MARTRLKAAKETIAVEDKRLKDLKKAERKPKHK